MDDNGTKLLVIVVKRGQIGAEHEIQILGAVEGFVTKMPSHDGQALHNENLMRNAEIA
jgi:hypothetical protein